jgi:hypothetical protein
VLGFKIEQEEIPCQETMKMRPEKLFKKNENCKAEVSDPLGEKLKILLFGIENLTRGVLQLCKVD